MQMYHELIVSDDTAGAEEAIQEPKELFNETGLPIEPFNRDKEREEGTFDAGGGYISTNFPQVKDAWLESIDGNTMHAFGMLHSLCS